MQAKYFVELDTLILKLILLGKGLKITTIDLKTNNNVKGLPLLDIKVYYYKVIIIKTMWY